MVGLMIGNHLDMLANKVRYFARELLSIVDGTRWQFTYTKNTVRKRDTTIVFTTC